MTYTRRRRARRTAFTLVEMLVVIAIIALLVSLTAAAVMRALVKGPEIQDRSEIGEMETKLTSLKRDFSLEVVPPSHLRLREDSNYTSGTPAIQAEYTQTKDFLQAMFGRHIADPGTQIDWNGDGAIAGTDIVLEGEQCLVFYLGGQPKQDPSTGLITMVGFPGQVSGGAANSGKRGPFFEFQPQRLKMFAAPDTLNGVNSLPFPVYMDAWKNAPGNNWAPTMVGRPYAYFSSYVTGGNGQYQSDCPSLGAAPYASQAGPPPVWVNPNSFQIISAGKDGRFGPGGLFNPTTGVGAGPGGDDQANFSSRVLGATAQ